MVKNFDVNKVLQDRLASSLGLDKYQSIMERVKDINIAKDAEFQRTFNGFYLIRRNDLWRKYYYEYFEQIKNSTPSFASILMHLYECTGNVEASFSSKMLATILPDKPIWDRYVLRNLDMELIGKTKEERLKNAISLYAKIEKWYATFLETEKANECIEAFDLMLPNYKNISSIKKIDSILWSMH